MADLQSHVPVRLLKFLSDPIYYQRSILNSGSTFYNQQVAEARSDLQLYQGLQEVNKDMLLTEDELDKFYTVLSREKRIRDARSEDEVNAALADIAKTEMLREEDLENLQMAIAPILHVLLQRQASSALKNKPCITLS